MQAAAARRRAGTERALESSGASVSVPPVLIGRERGDGPGSPGPRRPRAHAAMQILLVWTGVAFFIATQRYLRGPSLQPRLALPWGQSLAASLVTAYTGIFVLFNGPLTNRSNR